WHEHDAAYLTFVINGAYRESVRSATRECTPRSVVYHVAGERHSDEFGDRATACLDLHFDSAWLDGLQSRGCATDRAAFVDSPAAGRIASSIECEFRNTDGVSPMAIEGLLLELFAECERHTPDRSAPVWLRRVRDQLDACRTASLTGLAAEAGLHPTHLARTFRAHYGCS